MRLWSTPTRLMTGQPPAGTTREYRANLAALSSSAQDLGELSKLGHFLKGSSATLGFSLIRDSCQVIQQYGSHLNVDGSLEASDAVCLGKIREALSDVKVHTADLKEMMKGFFGE